VLKEPKNDAVLDLVSEAKVRGLFKAVPGRSREKTDDIWLLELCSVPDRRPAALQALLWRAEERARHNGSFDWAFSQCAGITTKGRFRASRQYMPAVGVRQQAEEEKEWQQRLEWWVMHPAYSYDPPETSRSNPSRHPWDGALDDIEFGEFATGIGVFAACFQAVGAKCAWIMEPNEEARRCATAVIAGEPRVYEMAQSVDPTDLPWVHVVVGGPECQPFSGANRNARGWQDERAYTFLRAIHIIAVQLPWVAWLENVAQIQEAQGGVVWKLIKHTLEAVGYVVTAHEV
jgi:hypothetical protein